MTPATFARLRPFAYLAAPVGVALALFFVPLAAMARRSLMGGGEGAAAFWSLEHYARFFGDAYYLAALGVTLGTAALVTLVALVVSYPMAYTYWQSSGRRRSLLVVLLLSPFYANVVVKVFGWMVLLSPAGLVNGLLTSVGLIAAPVDLLEGYLAVVIISVHRAMPFMVLLLASAMTRIDPELLEAARLCGASGGRVFRTVVLPLSMPGVVAGGIVVFSLTVSAYVVPALVGGSVRGRFLPVLMYQQITLAQNWGFGAAIGVILLVTAVAAMAAGHRAARAARIGRVLGEGFGR